jgi:iron complex outermembrane receptor protein
MTGLVCLVCAAGAQDEETADKAFSDDETIEEIVVTGSRIKKDTFATTTPIQILSTEDAQRIGILSISELLQKSTVSSGEQIDGSFNSNAGQVIATEAPPVGGVGSYCVNLRGLGCERTLVLVNDKRLGLAGIRGAPSQSDINMLPIGMVEAVDVLTGGLSTIYGADAVAGVVNVRLKQDFEGINLTVASDLPEHTGGEIFAASMTAGLLTACSAAP